MNESAPRKAFDPWLDAQVLAEQLRRPGAELLVALGAESWCTRCQQLRPAFEQLCARQAPEALNWLWLDLEDHAEFLGDFVPEDLPLLLHWRGGILVRAAVLEGVDVDARPAERLRPSGHAPAELPDLWTTFSRAPWASG